MHALRFTVTLNDVELKPFVLLTSYNVGGHTLELNLRFDTQENYRSPNVNSLFV